MRMLKKLAVLTTAMMLACGITLSASAVDSPTKKDMSKVTATAATVKYTGAEQKPVITVKDGETVLVENKDYTVSYGAYVDSDVYTVTVTGIGLYTGTIDCEYVIDGTATAKQGKVTAKAATKTVKASAVKKAAKKVKITVKKAKANKGKVSYSVNEKTKASLLKYVKVSKKGVVTLKKGAKKGTYYVTVKKAGYKKYNPVTKVVKIRVK